MSKLRVGLILVALAAIGSSFIKDSSGILPQPEPKDRVAVACDEYERLFRQVSGKIADQLERGDLSTDRESRDLRSEALKQALKASFLPLAEEEARRLSPWSPEAEIELLREYESRN